MLRVCERAIGHASKNDELSAPQKAAPSVASALYARFYDAKFFVVSGVSAVLGNGVWPKGQRGGNFDFSRVLNADTKGRRTRSRHRRCTTEGGSYVAPIVHAQSAGSRHRKNTKVAKKGEPGERRSSLMNEMHRSGVNIVRCAQQLWECRPQ